jgi:hypothetical protein
MARRTRFEPLRFLSPTTRETAFVQFSLRSADQRFQYETQAGPMSDLALCGTSASRHGANVCRRKAALRSKAAKVPRVHNLRLSRMSAVWQRIRRGNDCSKSAEDTVNQRVRSTRERSIAKPKNRTSMLSSPCLIATNSCAQFMGSCRFLPQGHILLDCRQSAYFAFGTMSACGPWISAPSPIRRAAERLSCS